MSKFDYGSFSGGYDIFAASKNGTPKRKLKKYLRKGAGNVRSNTIEIVCGE